MSVSGIHRAGGSVEDFCRACKTDRSHTIIVVGGSGQPLRVTCDYCESQHNYRGGPRIGAETPPQSAQPPPAATTSQPRQERAGVPGRGAPFPIVGEGERTMPMTFPDSSADLEVLLRRIIREEAGVTPVTPAAKWRGGTLVLRPGTPGLQEKSWPIETFFHKVVMLRNRLRTLEQHLNASELPDDVKVKLQAYISGCYGSLTSFNVLFADEADQFKGNAGD
jgi:hypothetical protein